MKKTLTIALLTLAVNSYASIHKEGLLCQSTNQMCFYSWPDLPKLKGWTQDLDISRENEINAQVPNGKNFNTAETIIYAKATKAPENSKIKNISDFILNDQNEFKKQSNMTAISEVASIESATKVKLRCFLFKPLSSGNWELVTYGEEADKDGQGRYFLTFVVSSKTEAGLNSNMSVYKEFINKYK